MGKEKLILAAVLILGLGLRLWGIDQSFWLDEASQAQLSSLSLSQIWSGRAGDFHPPLFYILAHFWLLGGRAEAWLRLLPVSFGVLSIWMMYWLAKEVLGKQKIKIGSWDLGIGICASFLLAVNPFHIYYSQEFRMYSLLALLGTWTMYLFIKSSHWFWVSLALMLYTHYASLLLLATLLIYVLVFENKKLKYLFLHFAFCIMIYLPWWPQFLRQLQYGVNIDQYFPGWRGMLTVGPVRAIPLVLFKLMAGRIDFVSKVVYALYLTYVLGLVGVSLVLAKVKRAFVFCWLLLPLLTSIVISFVIPLTQPFRLIFVLPALILILTQAVMKFPRLMLLLIVYIGVTGVVMYQTRPRLQREQWRQAAAYLQSVAGADPAVVVKFAGNFAPLAWYAPRLPVLAAVPTYPARLEEVSRALEAAKNNRRLYLLQYLGQLTDPYSLVEQSLAEQGFSKQTTINFEGVGFVDEYRK